MKNKDENVHVYFRADTALSIVELDMAKLVNKDCWLVKFLFLSLKVGGCELFLPITCIIGLLYAIAHKVKNECYSLLINVLHFSQNNFFFKLHISLKYSKANQQYQTCKVGL